MSSSLIKRLSFLVSYLLFCHITAYAMPPMPPITKPGTIEYGGDALYYQNAPNYVNQRVLRGSDFYNLPYDWGFGLSGKYYLSNNNDLLIEWYHYKQSSQLIDTAGTIFASRIPGQAFDELNKFDLINISFGQNLFLTERWLARMGFGLQYGELKGVLSVNNPASQDIARDNIIGPRVILEFDYAVNEHLSTYTNMAVLAFYINGKLISNGPGSVQLERGTNVNFADQGVSIGGNFRMGLRYSSKLDNGELQTLVGWDNNVYFVSLNRMGWSGLRLGLKWKA